MDDNVATVAPELPLGRGRGVEDQYAGVALEAARQTSGIHTVRAGGMSAGITAAHSFLHVPAIRV